MKSDPAGSPTENSGTKQSAEESGNGILKASAHHADARKDEAAKTDNRPSVHGKSFKRPHERRCSGEVHRSLRMSDTCKGERGKRRPNKTDGTIKLKGEGKVSQSSVEGDEEITADGIPV